MCLDWDTLTIFADTVIFPAKNVFYECQLWQNKAQDMKFVPELIREVARRKESTKNGERAGNFLLSLRWWPYDLCFDVPFVYIRWSLFVVWVPHNLGKLSKGKHAWKNSFVMSTNIFSFCCITTRLWHAHIAHKNIFFGVPLFSVVRVCVLVHKTMPVFLAGHCFRRCHYFSAHKIKSAFQRGATTFCKFLLHVED